MKKVDTFWTPDLHTQSSHKLVDLQKLQNTIKMHMFVSVEVKVQAA